MQFGEPSEANREQMRTVFRNAESKADIDQMLVWFALDESFAREDIVQAAAEVEREKGWR